MHFFGRETQLLQLFEAERILKLCCGTWYTRQKNTTEVITITQMKVVISKMTSFFLQTDTPLRWVFQLPKSINVRTAIERA